MKRHPNLHFDELKNPQHTYHYSREERLKKQRNREEKSPSKWYYRLVGNNRTTLQLLVFYIFLAVVFWFFWWAIRGQAEDKRVFRVGTRRQIEVRWIENEGRKGWNILLDNREKDVWYISFLGLKVQEGFLFSTNIEKKIVGNDYEVWFFPVEGEKPPLTKIQLEVRE